MARSYNKLRKLMIDKKINKTQLCKAAGITTNAMAKLVNGLTKSLARELAKDNIRVNAVAPGVTNTDMAAALPKDLVNISAEIPLGRVGEPTDVASAYLYFASDLASYVTGEIFQVYGAARA